MDKARIFALERPHEKLLTLYLIRSLITLLFTGPLVVFVAPVLYFRYQTMRYRFDEEGVSMSWGLLFRREVNLTYARIQDIHLQSGIVQRYLGLADIQIQTASGSASAEMTIEGLLEFEAIRDFLYQKMRGTRGEQEGAQEAGGTAAALAEVRDELRGARLALEALARKEGGHV